MSMRSSLQRSGFAIARQLEKTRQLAIKAAPAKVRPALRALWDLDLALADVVSTTTTVQIGAIRLAWWRERLEDLDKGIKPPAEPRLQAVAATLIPAGVSGRELAALEYCWLALFSPFPWDDLVADALAQRGAILFGIGARLLGGQPDEGEAFGRFWSLADGAQHCSDEPSRAVLFARARLALNALSGRRIPVGLGPLGMIAARTAYDLLYSNRGAWHRFVTALRTAVLRAVPQ